MDESNNLIDSHPFSDRPHQSCFKKYKNHLLIGLGIILVLGVVVGLIVGLTLRSRPSADGLANAVTVKNIMKHLQEFQNIANDPVNKGSRGVLEGYNQCLNYVKNTLSKTGCVLTTQSFLAPVFYERATPSLNYTVGVNQPLVLQAGVDVLTMRYGGNGTYSFAAPVKLVANAGCNETDWVGVNAGDIAIAMYQTAGNGVADCTAYQKATVGAKHGAGAILIGNDVSRKSLFATRIRGDGYAPTDYLVQIPVLAITHSVAETLTSQVGVTATIRTQTEIIVTSTENLYCTTPDGDANNLVVIGAHLDGVPAGPGINDNASGSATLLEVVLQFFKLKFKPKNQKIQFSWWGAEEIGLLGSRAFVNSSKTINSPVPFDSIKMGINFDMLASPNGIPEYHDLAAGNPGFPESATAGSNAISATFKSAFEKANVASLASPMTGGSDYYPFALAGIPAGGLATGAGGLKSMEQRTTYGGLANAAMDPCYHQPCDTIENINQEILGFTSQAAARAIATFSLEKDINAFLAKGYEASEN